MNLKAIFLIGILTFSCLAISFDNVNAGNIEFHRDSALAGGYWFNDWTGSNFYQTSYRSGQNYNYKTQGSSGSISAHAKSWIPTLPPFIVIPITYHAKIINYDGSDMSLWIECNGHYVRVCHKNIKYEYWDDIDHTEQVIFDVNTKQFSKEKY